MPSQVPPPQTLVLRSREGRELGKGEERGERDHGRVEGGWLVGRQVVSVARGPHPPGSPSITAQTASSAPRRTAAAAAQGWPPGGSLGPQQNSNFPFISAASPAVLKGRRSGISSQANWNWASSHSWTRGVGGGGGGGGSSDWGRGCWGPGLHVGGCGPGIQTRGHSPDCHVP